MKEKDAYLRAIAKRNREIRRLVAAGMSQSGAGRKFNLSRERIRQICAKLANATSSSDT